MLWAGVPIGEGRLGGEATYFISACGRSTKALAEVYARTFAANNNAGSPCS
jgi:hypothetical protein